MRGEKSEGTKSGVKMWQREKWGVKSETRKVGQREKWGMRKGG